MPAAALYAVCTLPERSATFSGLHHLRAAVQDETAAACGNGGNVYCLTELALHELHHSKT